MDPNVRKRRAFNFSKEELAKLLELVERHSDILDTKASQCSGIIQEKEKIWREIATELNAEFGINRSWTQIRSKYSKSKMGLHKPNEQSIVHICQMEKMDNIELKERIQNVDPEIKESASQCDSFDHDYVVENCEEELLFEDPFSGLDKWQKQFQILPRSKPEDFNTCSASENQVIQLRLELLKKEFESRQKREEELHREKIKILKQEQVINANKILLQQMDIKRIKLS